MSAHTTPTQTASPWPGPARVSRRWQALRRSAWVRLRSLRRVWARATAQPGLPTQLHLSWSEDPRHTLTATWMTPAGRGTPEIEIEPVGRRHERRAVRAERLRSPSVAGTLHRAVVRDLEPDTEYRYRVGSDDGAASAFGAWHQARTAPDAAEAHVRAVFVSDTGLAGRVDGTTNAHPELLRALEDARPLVVIGGGDYAYANRDMRFRDHADAIDAWFEAFEPLLARAPFMAQFGNHDVELGETFEDWAPRFAHPPGGADSRSFSFDLGAAHVVGLWAPGRAPREADVRWLEADLASEAARRATWRIVFQHAPLVSNGACHPARPELAEWLPRFDELGVDLHLSAHDQNYERTHPIRHGHPTAPKSRDARSMHYIAGAGVMCAKISPAGKRSERGGGFSTFGAPAPPIVAARDDTRHHWGVLDISRHALSLRVEGLSADGSERTLVEEVVISQSAQTV